MAIWIRNGYVITQDADQREVAQADVLIEGDRITAIGPDLAPHLPPSGVDIIDASQSIVMPGLINAHMHSNENFEKGMYDNLPLELWMLYAYPPLDFPLLSLRENYLRTMMSCIEMIRAGVTTVQDDIEGFYRYSPETVPAAFSGVMQAYADSGMRAWVTSKFWDQPFLDTIPFLKDLIPTELQEKLSSQASLSIQDQVNQFLAAQSQWQNYGDRLRVILAPSGPQRCSEALLRQVGELSDQYNVPIHTHVLETKVQAVTGEEFYGKTLVRYLHDLGLLSHRLTLIHAVWLTDDDIELLGEFGCSMVHNPLSNLKLGSGVSPIRRLLNAGVNVALGTDGTCTSDTPDLFEAIQCASLMHKIGTHNYDDWISAQDVLQMATMGGARSGLMGTEVGSLEVGKKADVILLSRRHWGFIPFNNPVQQLAYSATSDAVQTTIINGEVVMRDRQLLTLDEEALKDEIITASERFRRDIFPVMERAAKLLEPYLRKIHFQATARTVPAGTFPRRSAPVETQLGL